MTSGRVVIARRGGVRYSIGMTRNACFLHVHSIFIISNQND